MRHLKSAIVLVALLVMPLAVPVALTQPPGPGMGMQKPGVGAVSYTQNSTISPSSASVVLSAVITPYVPVNGSITASYQNGVLNAMGEFTSTMPEINSTINGSLSARVNGSFNYIASEGKAYSTRDFSVLLSFASESDGNLTQVSANLTGTTEGVRVFGNYSYSHTSFQGPVYVKRATNATSFEIAFDLMGDIYSNTTMMEDGMANATVHVWGSLTIDFNTGNQFQDVMYANMIAQVVTNLVNQLGLQNNVTVTVDNEKGAVSVNFDLYLEPGMMAQPMPGMPGVPGMGMGQGMGMEHMQMPVMLSGFTEDVNITYSLQCNVQVDNSKAAGSFEASVTGIPTDFFSVDSFSLNASLSYDEQANTTTLQAGVSVDGLDSPASAFYPLLLMAKLGLMKFSDAKVIFIGKDGVAYRLDSTEATEVIITKENKTLINDLKLVYNGTVYGFGRSGELVVRGPEGGHVVIPAMGNYSKIMVENAFKATIRAGSDKVVALAHNLQVEITNPMGKFKLKFENTLFKGSLVVTTLDPAQANSMLPAELQGAVVGPGLHVVGVLRGGGEVEIPLTKTPKNPALARILPNGTVEVISDVKVVNGVLKASVPGFSALVPIDLAETSQPPGGTTTTTTGTTETGTTTTETTTTTTETTTTETETTMTTTSPMHTETETETQTTTSMTTMPTMTTPMTTMPTPTKTTETTETMTTTTSETTTQTTTGATQETTTTAETTTTTAAAGRVPTTLIVAAVVVLALAGAAVMLLRR
jgi:hypothetical protein